MRVVPVEEFEDLLPFVYVLEEPGELYKYPLD